MATYTTNIRLKKPEATDETVIRTDYTANLDLIDEAIGVIIPQTYATGTGTAIDPWAGDCLNDALTACPTGGTIYMRAGYYTLSSTFDANKAMSLIGEGIGKTFIILDFAGADGFQTVDYCTFKGFTVDAASQTDGETYSAFNVGQNYLVMEDIEVKNSGWGGINLYQNNHSLLHNIYSHGNYEHGIHPGTDTSGRGIYNTYRDIYCWDNTVGGFDDRGAGGEYQIEESYNIYDNINAWDNGHKGIAIGGLKNSVLSNSFASGNGYQGIYLYDMKDFHVTNCSATLNGYSGLWINNADNVNLANILIESNDTVDTDDYGGIEITDCNDIKMTSVQSYDSRVVSGTDIAFIDGGVGADTITQTTARFIAEGFVAGGSITITGSTSNNVTKTIVSVVAGTITLATGSLIAEAAGDPVVITHETIQRFGLYLGGTNTAINLVNCKLLPNKTAEIVGTTAGIVTTMDGVMDGYAAVAGDIAYYNGTNWVRLAKGTANQYLKMNAYATAPIWVT